MSDVVCVYVDGSAGADGSIGVGVVCGSVVVSERVAVRGCALVAEACAVDRALDVAVPLCGGVSCVVYSDCAPLIALLSRAEPVTVPRLVAVISALRARLAALRDGGVVVDVVWLPRHKNREADRLARAALGLPDKPPRWLR